jgi:hypothetical protein
VAWVAVPTKQTWNKINYHTHPPNAKPHTLANHRAPSTQYAVHSTTQHWYIQTSKPLFDLDKLSSHSPQVIFQHLHVVVMVVVVVVVH